MFHEDINTVNISKRNYWLVICIAENNFKDDFLNIQKYLHPHIFKYCPKMEILLLWCINLNLIELSGFVLQRHISPVTPQKPDDHIWRWYFENVHYLWIINTQSSKYVSCLTAPELYITAQTARYRILFGSLPGLLGLYRVTQHWCMSFPPTRAARLLLCPGATWSSPEHDSEHHGGGGEALLFSCNRFNRGSISVLLYIRGGGDMTKILYHDMTNFISR